MIAEVDGVLSSKLRGKLRGSTPRGGDGGGGLCALFCIGDPNLSPQQNAMA